MAIGFFCTSSCTSPCSAGILVESLCSQLEMGRNPVGTGSLRENPVNGLPGFWFHHFFFQNFPSKKHHSTYLQFLCPHPFVDNFILSYIPTKKYHLNSIPNVTSSAVWFHMDDLVLKITGHLRVHHWDPGSDKTFRHSIISFGHIMAYDHLQHIQEGDSQNGL